MTLFRKFRTTFKTNKPNPDRRSVDKKRLKQLSQKKIDQILNTAKSQARDLVLGAKDEAVEIRTKSEESANRWQDKLFQREEALAEKQTELTKVQAALSAREQFLNSQKQAIKDKTDHVESLDQEYLDKLLNLANLTETEAREMLEAKIKKSLDSDKAITLVETENKIEEEADLWIQEIMTTVMPRGSTNYYNEYKSPIVRVPSNRIMQELLGTKDCNKDFFEQLAKVELVIDDQLVIKINSIDSVDREIARQTLEKLIEMRRINPAMIRRAYKKVKTQAENLMYKSGKKLCQAVGVHNLPEDIVRKLGKFTYRHSYGQNMIEHTLEETLIGISLAHELGVDSNVVRLGCLFHDIGKVIYDDEGTHVETGVAYLKEHNMPQEVIDCVAQSHEDEPFSSIESMIVHIADGISGARPAARHNDHEFTNRIQYLETTPLEYPGVRDAYAIQAGREVRVTVDSRKVSDEEILKLAQDLRDRIKQELTYPGSVTVNVIRESSISTTLHTGNQNQKN